MARRQRRLKAVETLKHEETRRKNIPTAEHQSVMRDEEMNPTQVTYERRNRELDPQLVWRGKDEQGWSDLVVQAPPLYIQEKVHPKVLIDDLVRHSGASDDPSGEQIDLFADFNGLPEGATGTEFYQHDANWSNRMILGDSLKVMASLAEREGLRGQVQCIYIDPPYGIKFNSNFQWSTTSRDVKDGKAEHITREPEQVKAFRDTWRDGIHSYLTYLRDRLTVARDLLTDSGSIFVQIGDENVHRVRALMDEVFGEESFVTIITFKKTAGLGKGLMAEVTDFVLWYAKSKENIKRKLLFDPKTPENDPAYSIVKESIGKFRRITNGEIVLPNEHARFQILLAAGRTPSCVYTIEAFGQQYSPTAGRSWSTNQEGMRKLFASDRVVQSGRTLNYVRYVGDNPVNPLSNLWADTASGSGMDKVYVVQTSTKIIQRCILMTTDPGDLVLDPTCGSGTTAYVAEQWGRRWVTIDTSRVALALARARIMGARYPYYLLSDSPEGQKKESELARTATSGTPTYGRIRQGFVYERVPHITLKSIANNAEIDVIWEKFQETLEPLRARLNAAMGTHWEEWEVPREAGELWPPKAQAAHAEVRKIKATCEASVEVLSATGLAEHTAKMQDHFAEQAAAALSVIATETGDTYTLDTLPESPRQPWPPEARDLHAQWWKARIARQKEIDDSISAKAEFEYLYDRPFEDSKIVRTAGPFTVESVSPHRTLGVGANDELLDRAAEAKAHYGREPDFTSVILDNLKTAGIQQAHKENRLAFTSLIPWPGRFVCAEGRYIEGDEEDARPEKRAAIFVGPEFGTVSRPDLVAAAREAGEANFDVLVSCAFSYDAHSSEFDSLGRVPVLKARMNADLHMADDLKNTGKGNLFVIFGEPDIEILETDDGQVQVRIVGVDVFRPNTGEVRSDGPEGIACWFIDTDYNEESFFVRQAYFLGANDPYKSLKTTLKAEIDPDAWATLRSDTSRRFSRPQSGRIAVKVINHLGDEVMKVFQIRND